MSNKDYTKFSKPEVKVTENTVEIEAPVVEVTVEKNEPKMGAVSGCVRLNVRETPSIDGEVVAIIKKGEVVEIFEEESTDEFYKVCTATGAEGFCMRKFITINP